MRGIDQRVDPLAFQVSGQPLRAAESADPHRNRLRRRLSRAAGQRERDVEVRPFRQQAGKLPRFRRAAEYENLTHVFR